MNLLRIATWLREEYGITSRSGTVLPDVLPVLNLDQLNPETDYFTGGIYWRSGNSLAVAAGNFPALEIECVTPGHICVVDEVVVSWSAAAAGIMHAGYSNGQGTGALDNRPTLVDTRFGLSGGTGPAVTTVIRTSTPAIGGGFASGFLVNAVVPASNVPVVITGPFILTGDKVPGASGQGNVIRFIPTSSPGASTFQWQARGHEYVTDPPERQNRR